MTDFPTLMSAPMVKAILREVHQPGTGKTMTRRLAWGKPFGAMADDGGLLRIDGHKVSGADDTGWVIVWPPTLWQRVKPGDRLWVRESLRRFDREPATAQYMADITGVAAPAGVQRHPNGAAVWQWKQKAIPSIHMPRWASRLTLLVTAVKIERLQDISEAEARAEGFQRHPEVSIDPEVHRDAARDWFSDLWEALHGVESWKANPEVVAVSFRPVLSNIDHMKEAA